MFEVAFSVPLSPITKKNSQRIVTRGGRPMIIPSAAYKAYEEEAMWFIPRLPQPIDFPVTVKCLFFMPTKRPCDLTNLLEAIDDVMVKAGLLKDDNFNIIESHDGSRVLYSKEKPRTEVYISQNAK